MAKASETLSNLAKKTESLNPKAFDFLLEEIPRIIKVRTRLGKGLLGRLKPLSENYKKIRKKGKISTETTTNKSNLTFTGKMLDSITGKRSGTLFTFFFKDSESDEKAHWADMTGRPFFDLTPSERNGLVRKISAIIRDTIRKSFSS